MVNIVEDFEAYYILVSQLLRHLSLHIYSSHGMTPAINSSLKVALRISSSDLDQFFFGETMLSFPTLEESS